MYFGSYRRQKVAVKMLFVMELTPAIIRNFYVEAQVLVDLQHECIIECKGITILPPAIGVVMQYCANGSLFDFLYCNKRREFESTSTSRLSTFWERPSIRTTILGKKKKNPLIDNLSEDAVDIDSLMYTNCDMILDAARAIEFVHAKGYMHCDIKSLNFLVTDVSSIFRILFQHALIS